MTGTTCKNKWSNFKAVIKSTACLNKTLLEISNRVYTPPPDLGVQKAACFVFHTRNCALTVWQVSDTKSSHQSVSEMNGWTFETEQEFRKSIFKEKTHKKNHKTTRTSCSGARNAGKQTFWLCESFRSADDVSLRLHFSPYLNNKFQISRENDQNWTVANFECWFWRTSRCLLPARPVFSESLGLN